MFIGIDDTDSADGMCTTYLGAVLAGKLKESGARIRRAYLIRLNPTVPYKTRGNAAVCIEADGCADEIFAITCALIEQYAVLGDEKTNPGVVITGKRGPAEWYKRCLTGYVTIDEVYSVIQREGMIFRGWKNCRGLIGACAAVSAVLADCTYELIAYRQEERFGNPRNVTASSVFSAEAATYPATWDSVDHENQVVVCVPHTPDPVLFGIRGESPFSVARATGLIACEPTGMRQIWCTNQGTDAHLIIQKPGQPLTEGSSYLLPGTVNSYPKSGRGGHVTFSLLLAVYPQERKEESITCIAFEPTRGFRNIIRSLHPGDRILVAGSFLKETINLEKIALVLPAPAVRTEAPVCPACNKQMTSAGTGKGYKCRRCRYRTRDPVIKEEKRQITPGWYEVPPIARRHLARPLIRGSPSVPGEFLSSETS
ncbi:MAG: DUF1743 domain-containing protein [Methanospirillaceae archaeon]|nr:DUF1743 domain-containing protein [Methanospirillaceae archaeon]